MIGWSMRHLVIPGALVLLLQCMAHAPAAPEPGRLMPSFSARQLNGPVYNWRSGRVTVFSFCAFWCDTWKEQARRLALVRSSLGSAPVDFITISVDARWSEQATGKVPGIVLLDAGSVLQRRLGITTIPHTLVVGTAGRIQYAAQGIVRTETLRQVITDTLDGPSPPVQAVYLIFDDFPSRPGQSAPTTAKDMDDRLLDVLRATGIKATFFCIGRNITGNEEVLRRAAREGHSLQIHSWNHSAETPRLKECARTLQVVTGTHPTLYHPPGSITLLHLNGQRINASVVNPCDYLRPGASELTRRILRAVKPGRSILLHAGVQESIDVLPGVIRSLRMRGYSFDLLE